MNLLPLIACQTLLAMPADTEPKVDARLARVWLDETSRLIESRFWNEREHVYVENLDAKGNPQGQPAFMWAMGVLLAGYAQAAKVDRKTYGQLFEKTFRSIEPYWSLARGFRGYSVLPRQNDPDRYYDDNAWIALALCEAYESFKDKRLLDRAIETYAFVVSCEDDKLGGGLYWHEPERKSKNTCTNAPAVNIALRIYRATRDERYLADAKRLYTWLKRLQDADGLYFDNIGLDGTVERTKWSYNTALMIRANCLFYQITKDPAYRDEAVRVASAAFKHWYRPEIGALADEACFAHHLFEAFYEVADITKDPGWIERVLPALSFVHDKTRSRAGFYGNRWDRAPAEDAKEFKLISQASALRAYAIAAAQK